MQVSTVQYMFNHAALSLELAEPESWKYPVVQELPALLMLIQLWRCVAINLRWSTRNLNFDLSQRFADAGLIRRAGNQQCWWPGLATRGLSVSILIEMNISNTDRIHRVHLQFCKCIPTGKMLLLRLLRQLANWLCWACWHCQRLVSSRILCETSLMSTFTLAAGNATKSFNNVH